MIFYDRKTLYYIKEFQLINNCYSYVLCMAYEALNEGCNVCSDA